MRVVMILAGLAAIVAIVFACDRLPSEVSEPTPTVRSNPTISPTAPPARATVTPVPPTATRQPSPSATATPSPTATPSRAYIDKGDLIVSGPSSAKKVAMTFDMGSVGGSTPQLLEQLKAQKVRSTFFVTGKWVQDNPNILKAIVAAGHEVGNHSLTHPDFTKITPAEMIEEVDKTEEIVKKVVSLSTKPYFRPPFGAYNATALKVLADHGYKSIYWTVDSTDWRDDSTTASVIAWTLKNIQPGGILVMHGGLQKTAEAIVPILEGMQSKGMLPTSLTELLKS